MKKIPGFLSGLSSPVFARLYLAQTINLLGDALTWLGLALLAFELAGDQSGTVLAVALTLRVMVFVVLSPIAGVVADRVDRKLLMTWTHLARMVVVCLLPFVTQVWQIYGIVLTLNIFYAFFAPTYTATIPLVTNEIDRPQAIALASATSQLLNVISPALAGVVAAVIGTRQVFLLDGITFLVAAILIGTLPMKLIVLPTAGNPKTIAQTIQDIQTGTTCLFADGLLRYALILQLITAIAGAEILVNTVGHVQGFLHGSKVEYGWAMAAFGVGATIAAIGHGYLKPKFSPVLLISSSTFLMTLALLFANFVNLEILVVLWAIAGAGQTMVNVTTQNLIADRTAVEIQGRVYGAHFAWSHLWWAFSYPLAGYMGQYLSRYNFGVSSLGGLLLLVVIWFVLHPQRLAHIQQGQWHEHDHAHDEYHTHQHSAGVVRQHPHCHLHFHAVTDSEQIGISEN
jgi:MFS transporter, NRE family, putaive nickel resistance protein